MTETVKLEGDEIVIRIPKKGFESFAHQGFNDIGVEDDEQLEGLDMDMLFKELVSELTAESEDGSTLVHLMMDQAIENAANNGSEALSIIDEE